MNHEAQRRAKGRAGSFIAGTSRLSAGLELMGRFLPMTLNRVESRKEGRPVRCGAWRWNRQRWFRFVGYPCRGRPGSGALGRTYYKARYEF